MNKHNKKYHRNFFLLLFSLLIIHSSFLIATVRYVSKTGSSTPPYTTWETAADSIQKCINICVFGDTIYVANGVYQEQVVMIDGLSLIGAGTDSCIIDTRALVTSQNYRSVETADSSLLTGFHVIVYNNSSWGKGVVVNGSSLVIQNKVSNANQGILNGSNAVISNNIFNNVTIGIKLFNSNAIVLNNIIYTDPNSTSTVVAGIDIEAFTNSYKPIIDANYIESDLGDGIYKSFGATPIIKNNVIRFTKYGNWAIFLSSSDSAYVYNNLILIGTGYSGIGNYGTQYLQIVNNYITGNSSSIGMEITSYNFAKNNVVTKNNIGVDVGGTQNLVFQYNNLWNNNVNYSGFTPDTTNFSVDPMVVNDDTTQGELDFHLQKYSPLIDAGDPTILDKDSTRSDIGLYGGPYGESYVYVDLPPRPPVNLTINVDSLIELIWNNNTEADFNQYNLYRDTTNNFQIDSTKLVGSFRDTFYYQIIPSKVESLYFKLTAVDNQGNESNPSEEVGVLITGVEDEWKPLNNYILYQNYPNPFNPSTKIGYKLKERGYVKLFVYDIKGELVSILVNQTQEAGYYEVEYNAAAGHSGEVRNLASGVYIYQIMVGNENNIPVFSDIKKMVYVK